jgi:hypothetical protein
MPRQGGDVGWHLPLQTRGISLPRGFTSGPEKKFSDRCVRLPAARWLTKRSGDVSAGHSARELALQGVVIAWRDFPPIPFTNSSCI